jgi:hypothetical protein
MFDETNEKGRGWPYHDDDLAGLGDGVGTTLFAGPVVVVGARR